MNLLTLIIKKIKYPYLVKIERVPVDNKLIGVDFTIDKNELLSFYTSKKGYQHLVKKQMIVESNYQTKKNEIRCLIARKWLSLVSVILIFIILLLGKNYIKEIKFSNETYYSKEVLEVIHQNIKDKKLYYTLNCSINELSHELRSRFPYYEWIGLRKNGSTLYIDIVDLDPILQFKNNNQYGNLVAKSTAYLINYHISEGLLVVSPNMTVKKGDLLVSGNLNYLSEKKEVVKSHPNGYINGKTYEIKKIKVPKSISNSVYTNRRYSKTKLVINNAYHKLENPFKDAYYQTEVLFKLGFIRLIKETYFERKVLVTNYDIESAKDCAKMEIEKAFYQVARNEYEKILKIEYLSTEEKMDSFEITMIVCKIENIAMFVPIDDQ